MLLVDKLKHYSGRSSFSTWLYRVVVNQCHDFRKKRQTDATRDTHYVELEAMGAADAADANRKTAWLYRAIAALQPPLPETALLVLGEELSHAEAAKILECKESTVSWRMHEIRKQLIQKWRAAMTDPMDEFKALLKNNRHPHPISLWKINRLRRRLPRSTKKCCRRPRNGLDASSYRYSTDGAEP